MSLEIVNPLDIPGWDDLVLATGKATIFHSAAWARVLHESYGYKPVYFTSFENGKLTSLMPFMEVDSWLTGRRGVSLPFTDFCESLAPHAEAFRGLVNAVRQYGNQRGWKSLEWRGNGEYLGDESAAAAYCVHRLALGGSEEELFSRFRSNTRRNIKKAAKEGVRVEIQASPEAMAAYYRLHCTTRRDHGLPPQPFAFFKRIHDYVIAAGNGFAVLAFLNDVCVAGAIYFHLGRTAIYKFGASKKKYQPLRPNNLVMWEAIRECVRRGLQSLSFGRTETDNQGLLQFKRGWNPEESRLRYYKCDLAKNSFQTRSRGVKGFHNRVFARMPIPALRVLGSVMYKHLG